MFGIDRRAASVTWTAALVILLLFIVYTIRGTLFVFTISLLLAYLLYPLVDRLEHVLPSRSRTPAVALVFLTVVVLMVIVTAEIGSQVLDQANSLAQRAPEFVEKIRDAVTAWRDPAGHGIDEADRVDRRRKPGAAALQRAGGAVSQSHARGALGVDQPHLPGHRPDSELLSLEGRPTDSRRIADGGATRRIAPDDRGTAGRHPCLVAAIHESAVPARAGDVHGLLGGLLPDGGAVRAAAGLDRLSAGIHSDRRSVDRSSHHSDHGDDHRLSSRVVGAELSGRLPAVSGLRALSAPDERRRRTASAAGAVRGVRRRRTGRDRRNVLERADSRAQPHSLPHHSQSRRLASPPEMGTLDADCRHRAGRAPAIIAAPTAGDRLDRANGGPVVQSLRLRQQSSVRPR